ncbi:unnamed protein product, partial [Amoebophrya sp. A25]|eukprot:GSA25T00006344001.1
MAQSVAHANLCGLHGKGLIHGPYACMLPPVLYAIFGTSRHGSVGTGGLVALLTGQFIHDSGVPVEEHSVAEQVVTMSAMIGLMLMLQALVKFLSRAALSGFVNASAVLIIESQVRDVIGLKHETVVPKDFPMKVYRLFSQISNGEFVNYAIGMLGLLQLFFLFGMKSVGKSKWLKELPETDSSFSMRELVKLSIKLKDLVVVFLAFVACYVLTTKYGIFLNNVGKLQGGFPQFVLPPSPVEQADVWTPPSISNLLSSTSQMHVVGLEQQELQELPTDCQALLASIVDPQVPPEKLPAFVVSKLMQQSLVSPSADAVAPASK